MLNELVELIHLQKIDNRIAEIETALANVPTYLKESMEHFETLEKKYNEAKAEYEANVAEKETVEKSYNENKALLDKAQKKLSTVKNSKEYEAVLKELDILKKNVNDEELKLLDLNEKIENYEKNIEEMTSKYNEAKQKLEEDKKRRDEENKELVEELEKLKAEREEQVKKIKKSTLSKYERIRKARNNLAIVRIIDETCTGCYMKVPPQLFVEVKKNVHIQQCPNCQRFLYYKEDEQEEN
ncbi:conserved hypothetical protein [Deferribacter desulfuricans SSM1]|uniref:Uncharacterized protein n=1 Tax=Deferribacter desulfuricans (strain DSM 14783 / JCM 11476 / NBRC 101012 / SSM1) TaxID=639282 RepID=D3PEC1_DEFDS|nr:C4-type zinc ribbon domain-containing protein [Deferribacter desulfuricans]BAI80944.1 conserved hypothetical protein [Deferribacter desulfuricans SSM1]